MAEKPHFLGIGAPRSGTTWLYHRLSEHPDFQLPLIKELHYFDRSKEYPSPSILSEDRLGKRLRDRYWRKKFVRGLLSAFKRVRSPSDIKWCLRYYLSSYDDDWYLSLFDPLDKICGEITPAYMLLAEIDVARIYELLPNVKTLFFMRDPLSRTWSSYRKNVLRKGKAVSDIQSIRAYLESDGLFERANYIETLNRYQKYAQPHRSLIGFFDAIEEQPLRTLEQVTRFLGGDSDKITEYCSVSEVSNASPRLNMPREIEAYLSSYYRPLITELSERFGGYCTQWMNRYYGTTEGDSDPQPTIVV